MGVQKREPSNAIGGHVNWCNHYDKGNSTEGSQKTKRELPYDPAITLLGIYSDKTMVQKIIYTPMFIAALFTTVKI